MSECSRGHHATVTTPSNGQPGYAQLSTALYEATLAADTQTHGQIISRVATNLEYSRVSLNMENSREFSGNSVQPQGKIVTNKVFLVRHSNISVKQLLTG